MGVVATLFGMMAIIVISSIASGQGGSEDYSIRMEKAEVLFNSCKNGTLNSNHIIVQNANFDFKEIEVRINVGGIFTVEPNNFTVTVGPYSSESTLVNITAPPNATLQVRDASVSSKVVKRNWIPQPGYNTRHTGFKVLVLQCAGVRMETSHSVVSASKGDEIKLSFTLWNEGNYYDDFLIKMSGPPSSWTVAPSNSIPIQNVPAGEHINFTITLYPKTTETVTLNITATSIIEGERSDSDSLLVKIEMKRPWTHYILTGAGLIVLSGLALAYVMREERRFAKDQEEARKAYELAMETKKRAEHEAQLDDHARWRPRKGDPKG